jgi:PAS domain S-box-containing protein
VHEAQIARRPRAVSLGSRLASQPARYWLESASVGSAYVVAAKFGINLSVAHGVITPVWAPSGIALAALLIFGRRLWPAVALGAFIANATSGADPLVAAGIAGGNTLEAVAGAFLLERVAFRINLERVRDVLALLVLGAASATVIGATNGVTVLTLADAIGGSFGSEWLLWWSGDALGILMVTPILLLAYAQRKKRLSRAQLLEGVFLLSALIALSAIVFLAGAWRYPYLIFPLLLWAALRFRQLGAAAASFVVGAIGTWGTMSGTLPFGSAGRTARVQIIQALVGVVAISLLVLGTTLAERESASQALRQIAARLGEAQALTHIGSWEWNLVADSVTWSDELYRIYGLAPQSATVTYRVFLDRVHPDDRPSVEEIVRGARETRQPFNMEHRIVLPDGSQRLVHGRGRLIAGEAGEPARMVGTAQDVTEQRQVESLRDDILSSVSHELRTPLGSVLNFSVALGATGRSGRA